MSTASVFHNINISQGIATLLWMWRDILLSHCYRNLLLSLSANAFRKSVSIWQSKKQKYRGTFSPDEREYSVCILEWSLSFIYAGWAKNMPHLVYSEMYERNSDIFIHSRKRVRSHIFCTVMNVKYLVFA